MAGDDSASNSSSPSPSRSPVNKMPRCRYADSQHDAVAVVPAATACWRRVQDLQLAPRHGRHRAPSPDLLQRNACSIRSPISGPTRPPHRRRTSRETHRPRRPKSGPASSGTALKWSTSACDRTIASMWAYPLGPQHRGDRLHRRQRTAHAARVVQHRLPVRHFDEHARAVPDRNERYDQGLRPHGSPAARPPSRRTPRPSVNQAASSASHQRRGRRIAENCGTANSNIEHQDQPVRRPGDPHVSPRAGRESSVRPLRQRQGTSRTSSPAHRRPAARVRLPGPPAPRTTPAATGSHSSSVSRAPNKGTR